MEPNAGERGLLCTSAHRDEFVCLFDSAQRHYLGLMRQRVVTLLLSHGGYVKDIEVFV